jgi:hypothetical protein
MSVEKVFVLHNTHDGYYTIGGKKNNCFYFKNPEDGIYFLKNTILPMHNIPDAVFDQVTMIPVPLPHNDTDRKNYWNIEHQEMMAGKDFRMSLPQTKDDYMINERYLIFNSGKVSRAFVFDVKQLN